MYSYKTIRQKFISEIKYISNIYIKRGSPNGAPHESNLPGEGEGVCRRLQGHDSQGCDAGGNAARAVLQ